MLTGIKVKIYGHDNAPHGLEHNRGVSVGFEVCVVNGDEDKALECARRIETGILAILNESNPVIDRFQVHTFQDNELGDTGEAPPTETAAATTPGQQRDLDAAESNAAEAVDPEVAGD